MKNPLSSVMTSSLPVTQPEGDVNVGQMMPVISLTRTPTIIEALSGITTCIFETLPARQITCVVFGAISGVFFTTGLCTTYSDIIDRPARRVLNTRIG